MAGRPGTPSCPSTPAADARAHRRQRVRRPRRRRADRARLERELAELNAIGIRLSAERDPRVLLETILSKAREITSSDAGSLYLVEQAPATTRACASRSPRTTASLSRSSAVTLPLDDESVAGHVALTGDASSTSPTRTRRRPARPSTINRSFDEHDGYRTKSMLVVPMRTPQGETIGALQLINCKGDWRGRARASRPTSSATSRPYGARHEKLAGSLASQAAVAVHNRRLYVSIRELFEGFVKASVTAIESRDPTTFGHSFRVAELTVGLAEIVDRCQRGRVPPTCASAPTSCASSATPRSCTTSARSACASTCW